MAVLVALGIVLALLVPALARASRYGRVEACAGHLKGLHKGHLAYLALEPPPPAEQGKAYWLKLSKVNPPLASRELYHCPLVENPAAECHYLGPAGSVATLGEKDPLGCDEELNHSENGREGGNVLLKSGEVHTDNTGLWANAMRGGKCRP